MTTYNEDAMEAQHETHGMRAQIGRVLGQAGSVIRTHRSAYIRLNIAYYGVVAVAMVFVASYPAIQQALTESVVLSFSEGPLSGVAEAYTQGNAATAALLTFAFNFFAGAVVVLALPSLLIPFCGVGLGLIRATLWGLLLAPTTPELQLAMIPHSLVLLLEGQGYILTMLAVWIHGQGFVSPGTVGAASHMDGWFKALRRSLWVYVLVAITLAVAAIYEAIEVIYVIPRLLS